MTINKITTVVTVIVLCLAFDAKAENFRLIKAEKIGKVKIEKIKETLSGHGWQQKQFKAGSLSSSMVGAAKKASKDNGELAVIGATTSATVNLQTKKEGILNKIGKPRYMGTTIGIPKMPEQPAKRIGGINKGPGIPRMPELQLPPKR